VALIAAKYFHGNIDHAISFAKSKQLSPRMLSKSRFNRRIHSIFEAIEIQKFTFGSYAISQAISQSGRYSISSFLRTFNELLICNSTVRLEISSCSDISLFDKPLRRLNSKFSGSVVKVFPCFSEWPDEVRILQNNGQ
jgi:hypothetical protein